MLEVFQMFFSYGTAAVAVPLIVFFVVVGLVVREAIGFGVMVTLLAFGLVAGFVIANYDIIRGGKAATADTAALQELKELVESLGDEVVTTVEAIRAEQQNQRAALESGTALTQQVLEILEKDTDVAPPSLPSIDNPQIQNAETVPSA